ncbi:MAG: prolipoprotein diacylglyceryl transferase [Candidatus Woesearchaeota archaeon]|nr:prolipoprotein diacylglyceryl transferase [Candidatus Woesearchaeota archaeon]
MFTHALNPTILSLGPLEIRWYGLMYVLAFIVIYYYVRSAIRQGKIKLTEKELDNLMGLLVVAMIIGARLFEAIFYDPSYYFSQPWKILYIWEGGLSFHGGFAGMALAGYLYARKKGIPFLKLVDVFIVPLALGNAFGRIGNFINGELYGIPTTLPWGVVFPGAEGPRHPTQLYEAAYNIVIFIVLYSLRNKKYKDGMLFGIFMILYSIFRISVEFLKDLPHYGPLTMGQWLTIPVFLIGLWLVWTRRNF